MESTCIFVLTHSGWWTVASLKIKAVKIFLLHVETAWLLEGRLDSLLTSNMTPLFLFKQNIFIFAILLIHKSRVLS